MKNKHNPKYQEQKNQITTSNTKKKNRYALNKKAITIIMGFALLISLAIAAGSVVMKLGSAQVDNEAECAIDINMQLTKVSGVDQLCYNQATKQVEFTLENGKNINIVGLLINTLGSKKAQTLELNDAKIPKAGMYVANIPYDQTIAGDIKQIKIIPKVNMYDTEQICIEKALILEQIRIC